MATERATATAGVSAWMVRALLLAAAGLFLWWGQSTFADYRLRSSVDFDPALPSFWWAIALFVLGGLGFGLATRFPFPRPRFAIGRLPLALIGLIPAIHLWLLWTSDGVRDGILGRSYWFHDPSVIVVGAALAGVAIASGVGARRGRG